jgi:tRNA (cmo5U34)-methyltransferase
MSEVGARSEAEARADGVGQNIVAANGRWNFGGKVADTFEDHIERSVPYYREGHDIVAKLSDYFLYDGAHAVELGCSTAALLRAVAKWNEGKQVQYTGIEVEPEMVKTAQARCAGFPGMTILEGDALDMDFAPADLIVSYYTIQFIRPARRQALLDKIYASLNWGGAFIMFEKVRAPDARFQDIITGLYTEHKLEQGFAEKEIVQKTRSLKGVLEPFSTQGNRDMIERAGFVDQMSVFKHICFEGFLAIK